MYKKFKTYLIYISVQTLCYGTQKVHPVSIDHPWDVSTTWLKSRTRLCRGIELGKGTKKCLQHWWSPRTQWPPLVLNGSCLEPPRLFLELTARPNWAIGGEGPWSGRWPRPRLSLTEFLCGDGITFQKDNHLCSTPPIRPLWKRHMTARRSLRNGTYTRYSGLLKPRLNSLAWMSSVTSGGNPAPSLQWSMVVAASCCRDVFQWQGD